MSTLETNNARLTTLLQQFHDLPPAAHEDAVLRIPQEMTETQKWQARANIGAISAEETSPAGIIVTVTQTGVNERDGSPIYGADKTYDEIMSVYNAGGSVTCRYDDYSQVMLLASVQKNIAVYFEAIDDTKRYGVMIAKLGAVSFSLNDRIDDYLSTTSSAPVQNKIVTAALNEKQAKLTGAPGQVVGFDEEGNPVAVEVAAKFETDATLILKDGILSVNTADDMEQDNTLPITSAAVHTTVGNIEILLKTI